MDPRLALPLAALAAVATALAVDLGAARLDAPRGFTRPWRRALAAGLLAALLLLGVFQPLAVPAEVAAIEASALRAWDLFFLHALLAVVLVAWGLLAYAGEARPGRVPPAVVSPPPTEPSPPPPTEAAGEAPPPQLGHGLVRRLVRAFRLEAAGWAAEVGLGLAAGVVIWASVLALVTSVFYAVEKAGGGALLPDEAPGLVAALAAQPVWLRVAGSLSAGFFEEVFFRGFLQPRVGIVLSTLLFALAHWSYGEPTMLLGVTLLSLAYAVLARWRGSVWAAVAAHAAFDAVQLLVVIPLALEAQQAVDGLPAALAALGGVALW